jgi:hypothetical protein
MAAQLADKGHPALQTVSADRFAMLIEKCNKSGPPSEGLVRMVAKGKSSLQRG